MRGKNGGKTKSTSPSSASLPIAGLVLFPTLCFGGMFSSNTPNIGVYPCRSVCASCPHGAALALPVSAPSTGSSCSFPVSLWGGSTSCPGVPSPWGCPHPEGALTLRVPGLAPISQKGKEGRSCAFNCPCKVSAAWAALVLKRECLGARSRAQ